VEREREVRITLATEARMRVSRRILLRGGRLLALLWTGIGLPRAVGAAGGGGNCSDSEGGFGPCFSGADKAILGAVLGAAAGVLVGWLVPPPERWEPVWTARQHTSSEVP
jgi:hypothetical protein